MREPGFAAGWAMPAWSAPVAFIDGKPTPDSLTGQPVQDQDHVAEEQSAAVNIVSVTIGKEIYYWGLTKSGHPTRLYKDKRMAIAEFEWMDIAFEAFSWLFTKNCLLAAFEDFLIKKGKGMVRLKAIKPLPDGVFLYVAYDDSPVVAVLIEKVFVKLFPGETHEEIEVELDAFLDNYDGGGGPGGI